MRLRSLPLALLLSGLGPLVAATPAHAGDLCATYDATSDWSDASNPNGPWSYREDANPLPHVDGWQRLAGGWDELQPGWAESEDANNRLPFWFQSNGSENFVHDYLEGDVVVHTHDGTNGSGNGQAELVWTSPFDGVVSIAGAVWMGRDINRSVAWDIYRDDVKLTGGAIASGDIYSRSSPFSFAAGSGGAGAIVDLQVGEGDEIRLRLPTTGNSGDFVGVQMTLSCISIDSTTTTTTTLMPTTTTTSTTTTTVPPTTSTTLAERDCGDPLLIFHADATDEGGAAAINASDALYVLRTAVGTASCLLCVCDVNDSGAVTATDSLIVLRNAVGLTVPLNCPSCDS